MSKDQEIEIEAQPESEQDAPPKLEIMTLPEAVGSLVSHLMAALKGALIYSPTHARVAMVVQLAEEDSNQAFNYAADVTLICIENELLFQGKAMNSSGPHYLKLAEFMTAAGIQRLSFLPGVTAKEIKRFCISLLGINEEGEEVERWAIRSSAHIKIGRLKLGGAAAAAPTLDHQAIVSMLAAGAVSEKDITDLKATDVEVGGEELASVDVNLLAQAQDAISSFASAGASERVSVKDSILNFTHYFLKYSDTIFSLTPLKKHDELAYNHSINVCMLCAAQAQYLDVAKELLRDIAVAGLLHDVGKLSIPPSVLNKVEPLDKKDKQYIGYHPIAGAQFLSRVPKVPRLAVIAAYEHHLNFNDPNGYPKSARCSKPHPVSQIVALADCYDAMRTKKPYRDARSFERTLEFIKKRTGTKFNPILVTNFMKVLRSFES